MAGSIIIELLMRTGSFETDSKRAEKRLREFKKEAEQIGKFVGGAFVAATAAVTATFGALVSRGREVIDSQSKLAQQMRTTFESVEVLSRAGDLAGVSMDQISAAGRQLELNLGRAAQGATAQADALRKLGLSAEQVSRLPLDQRIAMINKALRENVSETERAAVAADLFGARGALAIQALDPATIDEANRQIKVFGLNLSDIDASKVEQANDAMSTFGLAVKGVQNQLTVQFAPILKAIGDQFLASAEEAGGMGDVVQRVFERMIKAAGFVIDAIDGIRRTFQIVADALIIGGTRLFGNFASGIATVLETLDRVPGLDLSVQAATVRQFADTSDSVVSQAWANINETLERPLPSKAFEEWVRNAQAAGQAAAEAAVKGRSAVLEIPPAVAQAAESLKAIKVEDTFGAGIAKDLERGFADARRFVEATRTEVERLEQQIAEVQRLAGEGFFAPGVDQDVLERLNVRLEEARERLQSVSDESGEKLGELSEFGKAAAQDMQRAFADFLFDPFDRGLKGMLDSFLDTINRMVANMLAEKALNALFGGAAGGTGGGLAGSIGSFFGGGRAVGGSVSAGVTYRINELEPEFFRPSTSGTVIPLSRMPESSAGGVSVNQVIQVTGRVDQRTASQIASEAARRQRMATARFG